MNQIQTIHALRQLDSMGRYVFNRQNLRTVFSSDSEKTFTEGLGRMVRAGIIRRAARGIYVNETAKSRDDWTIERVALALRPADLSYVSLESALSEYGVISQIPVGRITIMTTGRSGDFKTPYGTIEFVHTNRSPARIRENTIKGDDKRPLRIARVQAALQDLRRVGRNLHLVDLNEYEEVLADSRGIPSNDKPTGPRR